MNKIKRNFFVFFLATFMLGWGFGGTVLAGEFPDKPVTIVIPWPAGTIPDIAFRILGELAKGDLGQPVVVTNVVGGSGTKGTISVKNAAPDGYTLLNNWVAPHVVAPLFNPDVGYSDKDFEPLMGVLINPFTVTVAMNHPANNLQEFVAWAKAEQKKRTLNVGICAALSVPRMVMEEFLIVAGITNYNGVPYPGCMPDNVKGLLDGSLDFTTGVIIAEKTFSGLVKNLAIFSDTRFANASHIPTAKEQGYDIGWGKTAYGWAGLVAPAGTPQDRLDKLIGVLSKWVKSSEFKRRMDKAGIQVDYIPTKEFVELWHSSRKILKPAVDRILAAKKKS